VLSHPEKKEAKSFQCLDL